MHKSKDSVRKNPKNDDQDGAGVAVGKDDQSPNWSAIQAMKRLTKVIMDNDEDDEDDYFLIQEKLVSERDASLERMRQAPFIPPEHRGLLVDLILDTQRELENGAFQNSEDLQVDLAERDKEAMREVYLKQMGELKGAIQQLSKCANPLANIAQRSQDDACLMEIEFRKLRQENSRLQRKIDEAKVETSRVLYPLTEALTQLDNRIEKMEGAITLAKQRLHIMDEEYDADYITPITDTDDRDRLGDGVIEAEKSLLKEFANVEEKRVPKSLVDVFKRGILMNGHHGQGDNHGLSLKTHPPPKLVRREYPYDKSTEGVVPKPVSRRTIPYESGIVPSSSGRRLHQQPVLSGRGGVANVQNVKELDQDIKPPWWD